MIPSYLWVTLRGVAMDRLNLPFFLDLGTVLQPYIEFKIAADTRISCLVAGFRVRDSVRSLLDGYPSLKVCRSSGEELLKQIDETFN